MEETDRDGFLTLPSKAAWGRMAKTGGKTLKALLNLATGGGGDVLEIAYDYVRDHVQEKRKARAEQLRRHVEKAGVEVSQVFDSPTQSEPLFDVFLSVLRDCLQDDEDEKVRFYAALMIGFASQPFRESLTTHQRIALLNAVSRLRSHDLMVFNLIGSSRFASHATSFCLQDLRKQDISPEHARVDWQLLPQAISSLTAYGLVRLDTRISSAPVRAAADMYEIDDLGKTLWKLTSPHLYPPA